MGMLLRVPEPECRCCYGIGGHQAALTMNVRDISPCRILSSSYHQHIHRLFIVNHVDLKLQSSWVFQAESAKPQQRQNNMLGDCTVSSWLCVQRCRDQNVWLPDMLWLQCGWLQCGCRMYAVVAMWVSQTVRRHMKRTPRVKVVVLCGLKR
jgi:hypothetical protein